MLVDHLDTSYSYSSSKFQRCYCFSNEQNTEIREDLRRSHLRYLLTRHECGKPFVAYLNSVYGCKFSNQKSCGIPTYCARHLYIMICDSEFWGKHPTVTVGFNADGSSTFSRRIVRRYEKPIESLAQIP